MTQINQVVLTATLLAAAWPAALSAGQQSAGGQNSSVSVTAPTRVRPQGFSVVLVVGDLQGPGGEEDVPAAARRALADMKDFLPYKSFKLVDAAWIMGTTHVVSRLRGPEERDYELEITVSDGRSLRTSGGFSAASATDARIGVIFSLRDTGSGRDGSPAPASGATSAPDGRSMTGLQVQLEALVSQLRDARGRGSNTPAGEINRLEREIVSLESRLADAQREAERRTPPARGSRTVINTTFSMDVGETVVVGTSRLSGNSKALIALLTAVPPKTTRR